VNTPSNARAIAPLIAKIASTDVPMPAPKLEKLMLPPRGAVTTSCLLPVPPGGGGVEFVQAAVATTVPAFRAVTTRLEFGPVPFADTMPSGANVQEHGTGVPPFVAVKVAVSPTLSES
jgi:hypothetical protein